MSIPDLNAVSYDYPASLLQPANMQFSTFISLAFALCASAQTVYLIRHGEKPSDGNNGLSAEGVQRAQCLRDVFGSSSAYNIGYIIAEHPKSGKSYHSQVFPPKIVLIITLIKMAPVRDLWRQ
jgi:hypothetical protein